MNQQSSRTAPPETREKGLEVGEGEETHLLQIVIFNLELGATKKIHICVKLPQCLLLRIIIGGSWTKTLTPNNTFLRHLWSSGFYNVLRHLGEKIQEK